MNAIVKTSVKNQATKVSNDTFKLIVEAKEVNLLNDTKKTTKELQAVNNSIAKNAKKAQQIEIKEAKEKRNINASKVLIKWLEDTQSKTALEKYVKNNPNYFTDLLTNINKINKSNVTINQVNKQLFKYGHKHELNKIDFDGNIIEDKIVFSMKFFATASNSLLTRFAKYGSNMDTFKKDSDKATELHLQNKFDTFVKNSGKFFGSQKIVNDLINDTIKKHPNATNQQIVNLINELKKEYLDNI